MECASEDPDILDFIEKHDMRHFSQELNEHVSVSVPEFLHFLSKLRHLFVRLLEAIEYESVEAVNAGQRLELDIRDLRQHSWDQDSNEDLLYQVSVDFEES